MGAPRPTAKRWANMAAAVTAVVLLVGPGVAQAQEKKPAVPAPVIDKLKELDNQLNGTIILAGHDPPLLKGDDLRHRILVMHQLKLDALDAGFPPVFGLPYTTTFKLLDCIDANLRLAITAKAFAAELPSDANADPVAFMKAAAQCGSSLVSTLQAQQAGTDVIQAAQALAANLTKGVASVQANPSGFASSLIEDLTREKENLVKHDSWPKVFGMPYWTTFRYLETIDADLAAALLISFTGTSFPSFGVSALEDAEHAKENLLFFLGAIPTPPGPTHPEPPQPPAPQKPGRHHHHHHHHHQKTSPVCGPGTTLVNGVCVPTPPAPVTTVTPPGTGKTACEPKKGPLIREGPPRRDQLSNAPSTGTAPCPESLTIQPDPAVLTLEGAVSFTVDGSGFPPFMPGTLFAEMPGCPAAPKAVDTDATGRFTSFFAGVNCVPGTFPVIFTMALSPFSSVTGFETFQFQ